MTTESLKKQAREHEQNEAWEKALGVYRRAIDQAEDGGEPEIGLYNRVADLELRLGNVESALEQYERAIELYLESDLPNNAIAICRKIQRNVPGRPETFLRMGEIRGRQGFQVEARQHILTYAEMMEGGGHPEAATAAIETLVQQFPGDAETRIFLGERLVGLGQTEAGVAHLLGAWKELARRGAEDHEAQTEAEALEARILELDPAATFPTPGMEEATGYGSGPLPGLESSAGFILDAEVSPADPEPAGEAPGGFAEIGGGGDEASALSAESLPEADSTFADDDLSDLLGHADGGVERFLHGAESPAAPSEVPASDEDEVADEEALPGLEATGFEELEVGGAEPEDMEPASEPLAGFSHGDFETGVEAPEAPEWTEEGDDEEGAGVPLPGFDAPPPDWGDPPVSDFGEVSLEDAPTEVPDTVGALEGALADTPDRVDLHEALVDRAQEMEDRRLLIRALAGLAAALERGGEGDRAMGTWDQLLQLDPRHQEALEGKARLARSGGAPQDSPPPVEDAGFVDLGALVLDDEEAPTTRWVVQDERSGDEDADFAQMLSKFKAKVAQHITRDDARASYDLGTAYREMGLMDEAIGMFQQALRAQPGHLASLEMLGQCFLDREEPQVAIRVLERALDSGSPVEDDLLGIYYFLGVSHEQAGNPEEAREFYEKVFSLDINFKDVTERLRSLR